MTDRRSKTSRANLGDHIPQALDPKGTVIATVRLTTDLAAALDRARGPTSRSQYIRELLQERLTPPR